MRQPIVVLGAGGFARQVPSLIRDINAVVPRYDIVGFLAPENSAPKNSLPVLGTDQKLSGIAANYVIGIGIPSLRASLDEFATGLDRDPVTLVHPQTSTEMDVSLGPGCIVMPGVRLQASSSLGRHVLVNANAVVGHDCQVDDHAVLSPLSMLAGDVRIGRKVLIGAGAVVLPGRAVGDDAVIGAGAVVTTDVPPGACAMGVPARWWRGRLNSSSARGSHSSRA